jgi:hypothetical protein
MLRGVRRRWRSIATTTTDAQDACVPAGWEAARTAARSVRALKNVTTASVDAERIASQK